MIAPYSQLQPGAVIRLVQQVPHRDRCWTTIVEGTVVSHRQAPTGAWYAHARNQKLWLDRITIRLHDGELIVCALDQYSHVEVLCDVARDAANTPATSIAISSEHDDTARHGRRTGRRITGSARHPRTCGAEREFNPARSFVM